MIVRSPVFQKMRGGKATQESFTCLHRLAQGISEPSYRNWGWVAAAAHTEAPPTMMSVLQKSRLTVNRLTTVSKRATAKDDGDDDGDDNPLFRTASLRSISGFSV